MNPSTDPVTKYFPSGEKRAHSTCERRPNCTIKSQKVLIHTAGELAFILESRPATQMHTELRSQFNIRQPQRGAAVSSGQLLPGPTAHSSALAQQSNDEQPQFHLEAGDEEVLSGVKSN